MQDLMVTATLVAAVLLALPPMLALRGSAAAARDAQAQLDAVESTSREWSWQADLVGGRLLVVRSSAAVEGLLGATPAEVIGTDLLAPVHHDDLDLARSEVARAIRERTPWHDLELRWRHRSGAFVVLQGSAVPVTGRRGTVVGFRGIWRAVTHDTVTQRRLVGIVHRVRELVAAPSLGVVLQPIVDVTTGSLCGVEALVRFADDKPPEEWFADAHEAGVGTDLELLALRTVLGLLGDPGPLPESAYLSVNASPSLILDPGFHSVLRSGAVPLDRLVIEITEHAAVTRYDQIRAEMLPYRERGLRLAVDDTGAGYASFNHVLRLRPDIIKLDRSLLHEIDRDPARRAFVTAIVLMALELDAAVTAEGVERAAELDTLRSLGVDTVQGYLLSRPTADPAVWAVWSRRDWGAQAGFSASMRAAPS